jgi:hypothetical protein
MSAENATDLMTTDREKSKRTRRALPITKRVARSGKVSYTFQIDAGTKPDGSRDRRRYTYTTLAEAKREYARIMTEAAAGTLVRRDKVTVGAFLAEWLDSRRVRSNTLDGYRAALKPVIDYLGTVPLQHLDTPHLDELVTLRLTGEPIAQRDKRGRRSAEVLAYLRARPEGAGIPSSWPRSASLASKHSTGWCHPVMCCARGAHDTLPHCRPNPRVRKCPAA